MEISTFLSFYFVCCVLGFFEIDLSNNLRRGKWASRYDFGKWCLFNVVEVIGWILSALAIFGFPGIIVGKIVAWSINHNERTQAEYKRKEFVNYATEKFSSSKYVDLIANKLRSYPLDEFLIEHDGICDIIDFKSLGLPLLDYDEREVLGQVLINKMEGEFECVKFEDINDDKKVALRRIKEPPLMYVPTTKW